MDCNAFVSEQVVDVHLKLTDKAQKYLIEFILSFSDWDFETLATLLGVSPLSLNKVITGKEYLKFNEFVRLGDYFSMLTSGVN